MMRWVVAGVIAVSAYSQTGRPRAREIGVAPGALTTGALNAITDVAGVRVGHTTINQGETVRTGVTAILPHAGNLFQDKVAGAVFVGNAFGKLAGSTQVQELGTIETPIVLTNTLSVGTAMDAVVRWTLAQPGNENVRSVNAVVGETNDGGLNDIRGLNVTRDHVVAAIADAKAGPVEEGAVGVALGLPLAALLGFTVSGLLYDVKPLDPVVFVTAPAVLAVATLFATWLPARRATRVTPLTALRAD